MDDVVSQCKRRATDTMERFLRVLSFVPADKLAWSPAPTAKSAMQIAAHCAGYSRGFARLIRAGRFPDSVDEFRGPILAAIEAISTVDEAEAVLRQGTAETIAALDTVRPEQVGGMVESPQGQTPFMFFMTVPANHLIAHTAQVEYLQTCWDDQEVHL